MKIFYYLMLLFILSTLSGYSSAQNFFPLSTGNKYQIFYEHANTCYNEGWRKHLASEIDDSLIFNGEIFYKYNGYKRIYYFKYDSTQQKLYIYDDFFHKKLAADFNLQNGVPFVSYINGTGILYDALGTSYINVFGQDRLAWSMVYADPSGNGWQYYIFIDGIGFYRDYYYEYCGGQYMETDFYDIFYFSAIINGQPYNQLDLNLDLLTDLNDRRIDEFPFTVNISLDIPIPELLDSLYLYYQVVRGSSLIFDHQVPFNPTYYTAIVNLDSTILAVGDKVNLKIVASDTSIFQNRVTLPDTGFYTIIVLGDSATSVSDLQESNNSFLLKQNYPNPFNPATTVSFVIGKPSFVTLKVYDVLGNEVAVLVNEEKPAGSYSVKFDGSGLSSGIYFYRIKAGDYTAAKKIILLK